MNADAIAGPRAALLDHAGGKFEHRTGPRHHAGGAPGREVRADVHDPSVGIEKHCIDRVSHGEGVDRSTGNDPQGFTGTKRRRKEQAAQTSAEGIGSADALRQHDAPREILRQEHAPIVAW